MSKSQKKRVQFDFSSEALSRVDRLMTFTDVTSRADVVRNSIRLYEWLVERAREGKYMILVEDGGREGAIDLGLITAAVPSVSDESGGPTKPARRR